MLLFFSSQMSISFPEGSSDTNEKPVHKAIKAMVSNLKEELSEIPNWQEKILVNAPKDFKLGQPIASNVSRQVRIKHSMTC